MNLPMHVFKYRTGCCRLPSFHSRPSVTVFYLGIRPEASETGQNIITLVEASETGQNIITLVEASDTGQNIITLVEASKRLGRT